MKNLKLKTLLALTLSLTTTSAALAGNIQSNGLHLRGDYFLDKKTKLVRMNIRLENSELKYSMRGQTLPVGEFSLVSTTNVNFNNVRITKSLQAHPERSEEIQNEGVLTIYPLERHANNMVLAGISVSGMYENGLFDAGIAWNELNFDSRRSYGELDYDTFDGYYTPRSMSLGPYAIRSANNDGYAFNLDDARGQNMLWTSFVMGELKVRGQIQYSDVEESHTERRCSRDSDGDEHCHNETVTEVVATTGHMHWYISKNDGGRLVLAEPNSALTTDDHKVQALMAWIELMTYEWR